MAVELGQEVPGHDGELGAQVTQIAEDPTDVAQRVEALEVTADPRGQDLFLGGEVVVEATGAGAEPGGGLDLGDARPAVAALAEEAHRCVDDALPGGG